jgi:hypothetical protein
MTRSATPTRTLVFDADRPEIAHTRIDCPDHLGLIELVETFVGGPCDDPEIVEHVAHAHGLLIEAHLVLQAQPCPHCTLVAAPYWLAAA